MTNKCIIYFMTSRTFQRISLVIILLTIHCSLLTAPPAFARPTSFTNVAKGLYSKGTFQDPAFLTDDNLSTYAKVTDVKKANNFIELDLGAKYYLRSIKIYFDKNAFPTSFSVDRKIDEFTGSKIKKGILPATFPKEGDHIVVTLPLENIAAKLLRFNFDQGFARAGLIRIAEIKVYPNMDIWPAAKIEHPKIITDTEALFSLRSNLDFTGTILLEKAEETIKKIPTGFYRREHAVFAHSLDPGTEYSYKMSFTDFHGNISASDKMPFKTRSQNILLNKPVDGTFTAFQPDDPKYIKPEGNPIVRVNDGKDSYFTSMVTSREPDTEDQYLIFDLENKAALDTLFIFWRALAYSKAYQIDISDDAENWETVLSQQDAAEGILCYSSGGDPMLVIKHDLKNKKARYLRIFLKKGSPYYVRDPKWKFVQIMEIKLF